MNIPWHNRRMAKLEKLAREPRSFWSALKCIGWFCIIAPHFLWMLHAYRRKQRKVALALIEMEKAAGKPGGLGEQLTNWSVRTGIEPDDFVFRRLD